jgi:CheY-like chemotaxis protein
MSKATILVIDDSTTIRRLADRALSNVGYVVTLAATAEEGVRLARESRPDLILLDHQLPGTTGFEVCQELLAADELRRVPVILSSTLRKRAYVQYADVPNVVDLLPKPYAEELLITTVANSLETAVLVVESQSQGTAVPEVMNDVADPDLAGTFASCSARELLDFLNNGRKQGVLEMETGHNRFWIYLDQGRIQGITATGVAPAQITQRLPASLQDLAPVLNLTSGRGGGSEIEGLVELLNTNVLDPRLLRRLLRHQASVLLLTCFRSQPQRFRFDGGRRVPALFQRLPLDVSSLALLVEGALSCDEGDLPGAVPEARFTRRAIRGQNLDRGGLAAQHAALLGRLTAPQTVTQLAAAVGCGPDEVRRVLYGMELAGLVEEASGAESQLALLFEPDALTAEKYRKLLTPAQNVRIASDPIAFQLLLKRSLPQLAVVDVDAKAGRDLVSTVVQNPAAATVRWIAVTSDASTLGELPVRFAAVLPRPFEREQFTAAISEALDHAAQESGAESPVTAVPESEQEAESPEAVVCPT